MNVFSTIRVAILCCGSILAADFAAPGLKGAVIGLAHPGAKFVSAKNDSRSLIGQVGKHVQGVFVKSSGMSGIGALKSRNAPVSSGAGGGMADILTKAMGGTVVGGTMGAQTRSAAQNASRPAGS